MTLPVYGKSRFLIRYLTAPGALFLLLLAAPDGPVFSAGTTDTLVTTENGFLVGEIKGLSRGKLTFDTDATDKIPVKWHHVRFIRSPLYFRVELSDGQLFFGQLDTDTTSAKLIIRLEDFVNEIPLESVVGISRIKATFWDRLDLSISAGLNFQKGSGVGRTNLTLTASERRDLDIRRFKADFVITVQKEQDAAQRHDVSFQSNFNLGDRWFANTYGAYQKNTELGLESRFIVGGGGGRYVVNEANTYLYGVLGLFVTWEQGRDSLGNANNVRSIEGLLGSRYALYKYDTPELDLETFVSIFPRLPDFDRLRIEFEIVLKWEIVKDFTWDMTFYNSFDSRPPSEVEGSLNDYGINFALGWTL